MDKKFYVTFKTAKLLMEKGFNKEDQKRYLVNSYRVLLTRSRQGMIIFVPKGVDPEIDATRDNAYYDGIYNYLLSCGIKELK